MHTRCTHTGLPMAFCGHCNHTSATVKPAFKPIGQNDEPRFQKGRDSAKWVGIGQHTTGGLGTPEAAIAAFETSRYGRKVASEWAAINALKTLKGIK